MAFMKFYTGTEANAQSHLDGIYLATDSHKIFYNGDAYGGGGGDLGDYLPLSGGTLTGNLIVSGEYLRVGTEQFNSAMNAIAIQSTYFSEGISLNTFKIDNWNNWGAALKGLNIRTANGITNYGPDGVTIPKKTSSDLLNAGGGTTSIDELKSQVSPDLSNYATKNDLSGYLPLTGGTMTGPIISKSYVHVEDGEGYYTDIGALDGVVVNNGKSGEYNSLVILTTGDVGEADGPCVAVKDGPNYSTFNISGITLFGKTTSDLLNAGGSTTPISDIATQVQAILVDGAPETLDTLNELAAALGDDPNFATTLTTQLGNKADKSELGNYLPKTGGTVTGYLGVQQGALIQNGLIVFNGSNTAITIQGNTSGDGDPGMLLGYNKLSIRTNLNDDSTEKISISENGIVIKDKTTYDLLNGAGGTTKLKTLNGESLLGEGNIQIETEIPIASPTQLGAVRVGDGLEITSEGILNCTIDPGSGTVSWGNIQGKPTFATVATTGSYNDLTDKPTIPSAYTLPTASSSTKGGVKIGSGLSMDGEVLSVNFSGYATQSWVNSQGFAKGDYLPLTGGTLTGDLHVGDKIQFISSTGEVLMYGPSLTIQNGSDVLAIAATGIATVNGTGHKVFVDDGTTSSLKTVGGQSILGSGNISFKNVGGTSIVGSGNISFKTVDGQSIIGSGDITPTPNRIELYAGSDQNINDASESGTEAGYSGTPYIKVKNTTGDYDKVYFRGESGIAVNAFSSKQEGPFIRIAPDTSVLCTKPDGFEINFAGTGLTLVNSFENANSVIIDYATSTAYRDKHYVILGRITSGPSGNTGIFYILSLDPKTSNNHRYGTLLIVGDFMGMGGTYITNGTKAHSFDVNLTNSTITWNSDVSVDL